MLFSYLNPFILLQNSSRHVQRVFHESDIHLGINQLIFVMAKNSLTILFKIFLSQLPSSCVSVNVTCLFQLFLVEELLSPIITPLILCFC